MKDGWQSGGIQWRAEFIDRGINPDAFAKLPGYEDLLTQYMALNKQGRVIFLNTLYREYEWLRNK